MNKTIHRQWPFQEGPLRTGSSILDSGSNAPGAAQAGHPLKARSVAGHRAYRAINPKP